MIEDQHERPGGTQMGERPVGARTDEPEGFSTQAQPTEEEMRAAYEAELNRITSTEMILQTTVSLLNIGGRRLGLASAPDPQSATPPAAAERDLEQVRDAIDGARALMPILERHMAGELGPLRDAISQLQMAYAREVQSARASGASVPGPAPAAPSAAPSAQKPTNAEKPAGVAGEDADAGKGDGPGPAQASGRLWVPGR